ncbi:hypothetical protein [Zhihengliuella salsuginis]|uniref:DUF2339 domain-containing protein n=1 Tax=Zhihengliuella salsuginis TaxID=578222 RepID=A0ABQ3GG38_9MICC|nr:hypothetical protein [Zhihengliuella salsuginis]GHD04621.1 hypothetical protein GCM10008096_12250 [Zhihengliuella salsuginis]
MGTVLVLVLLLAVVFTGGWLLGRHANRRASERDQRENLASAWQEGHDAAVAYLVPPGQRGLPGATRAPEPTGAPQAPVAPPPSPASPAPSTPSAGPPPVRPVPDPAARQLRNVNIALYVAAGLLIGAGLLFISFPIHPAAKLSVLGSVGAVFYGGGLAIHARSRDLRAAAAALTAIGLALIPVLGVAWYILLPVPAATAWLVASAAGSAAFVFASVRLRSQIVAVVSLTFFVSLAWSGGAVLNRGLIWYFVFTMVLAALVSAAAVVRPAFLGSIYLRTFVASHRFLVPGLLVAAVLMSWTLSAEDLLVVGAAASTYYGAMAVTDGRTARAVDLSMLRLVASATLLVGVYELSGTAERVVWAALLIGLAQLLLVACLRRVHRRIYRPRTWRAEVWGFSCASAAVAVFTHPALHASPFEGGDPRLGAGLAIAALGIGIAGYVARLGVVPVLLAVGAVAIPIGLADGSLGDEAWRVAATSALALGAAEAVRRRAEGMPGSPLAGPAGTWGRVHLLLLLPFVLGLVIVAVPGLSALGASPDTAGLRPQLVLLLAVAVAGWLGLSLATLRRTSGSTVRHDDGAGSRVLHVAGVLAAGTGALALHAVAADALWMGIPVERLLWWVLLLVTMPSTAWIVRARDGARTVACQAATGSVWLVALLVAAGRPAWPERGWAFEVLLTLGFLYSALLVFIARRPGFRAVYVVAAQALLTWLALDLAGRLDADWHARIALGAATLAAGQAGRLLLRGGGAAVAGRRSMSWAALGLLLLVPFAYMLLTVDYSTSGSGTLEGARGADQASLLIQLGCLAAYALVLARRGLSGDAARWSLAVPPVALAAGLLAGSGAIDLRRGGWLPTPLWTQPAAAVALAAGTVACVVVADAVARRGAAVGRGGAELSCPSAVAAVFAGFGLFAAAGEHSAFSGLVLAAAAYAAVRLAFLWERPGLVGAAVLIGAAAVHGLLQDPLTGPGPVSAAVFGSGAVGPGLWALSFMAAACLWWVLGALGRRKAGVFGAAAPWARRGGLLAATLGALVGQGGGTALVVTACVIGAAAAVLAVGEWPAHFRRLAEHGAVLIVAAYAVRLWHEFGDPSLFWTLQALTAVSIGLAVSEYVRPPAAGGVDGLGRRYLLGAAAVLTCSAPVAVFADGGWSQWWVLVGFVGFVIAGLVLGDRVLAWWGAAGVAAALAWFLRDYSFILLALLAAVLIAFALLSLRRLNRGRRSEGTGPADPGL